MLKSVVLTWLCALLQPYVPVFWYPWGSEQKMTAAMSSRRSLNPHVHAAIMNGSKRNMTVNNNAAAMPTHGGDGQTIV